MRRSNSLSKKQVSLYNTRVKKRSETKSPASPPNTGERKSERSELINHFIMFKKTFLLLPVSLLVFTGCFGGGDNSASDGQLQNFTTFESTTFSISKPQQWKVIEAKDFSNDIPNETQIIFRDNVLNDKFTSNANVTKKILKSPISSYDFAKSQISETKNTLLNYKEISRDEEFNVVVGGQMQKSILIMFEGKQTEAEPTIRIVQVYAVNGTDAYTATAAYLLEADEVTVDNAKNIVKSFKIL